MRRIQETAKIIAAIGLLVVCLAFFAGTAFGAVYLIREWKNQPPPAEDQTPPAPCDSGPPLTSC